MDSTEDSAYVKLMGALYNDNAEDVAVLLSQGVNVNQRNKYTSETVLHVAVKHNYKRCLPVLLEHGADPNMKNLAGETPLHIAVWIADTDAVRSLIQSGAVTNVTNPSGETALEIAGLKNNKAIIRELLKAGAKIGGTTLLYSVAEREDSEFMLEILQHCEKIGDLSHINSNTDDSTTPLHMAAHMGLKDCIEYLLKLGADPNFEDISNLSGGTYYLPLHAAISCRDIECVKLLLPPVTSVDQINRCALSPFYDALETDESRGLEVLKLILQAGIDVNALHEIENRDLYSTFTDFRVKILCTSSLILNNKNLWDNGDHDIFWYDNLSALSILAMLGGSRLEYARLLLDAGARIDPVSSAEHPILVAALEMVEDDVGLPRLLVERGASVNLYHNNFIGNMTVLASLNNFKSLEFILNAGAEVDSLFQEVDEESDDVHISMKTVLRNICKTENILKVLLKLLDYSKSVKCTCDIQECLEDVEDTIEDKHRILNIIESPRSLQHLSRVAVRRQISSKNLISPTSLNSLHLPTILLDYLLHKPNGSNVS